MFSYAELPHFVCFSNHDQVFLWNFDVAADFFFAEIDVSFFIAKLYAERISVCYLDMHKQRLVS